MNTEELVEQINGLNDKIRQKMHDATQLLDEGDVEEADAVLTEVEELREQVKTLKEKLEESEEESETQSSETERADEKEEQRSEEDTSKESKSEDGTGEEKEKSEDKGEKEEEKTETEDEKDEDYDTKISELKEQIKGVIESLGGKEDKKEENEETSNEKEGTDEHKRSEGKMAVEREVTNNVASKNEEKYLEEHVIKRSESVDGIKKDNDGVYVPEGVIGNLGETRDETESLSKYATVRNVPNAVGKAYFLNQSGPVILPTVPELNVAPQLGVVGMLERTYELVTRRGYIIVSEEAWEDAEGLKEEVSYVLKRAVVDTENHEILDVFNNSKDIETVDIKNANDFIGIGLRKAFQKHYMMSASKYNQVAKKTDKEGRSILQTDLTKPLAETILGKPVLVLDDELVGEDFAIYGDLSKAVVLFKKASVQTKWTDYLHYGRAFQVAVRQEAQILNSDAVVKLNIIDSTEDTTEVPDEEPAE